MVHKPKPNTTHKHLPNIAAFSPKEQRNGKQKEKKLSIIDIQDRFNQFLTLFSAKF